MNVLCLDWPGVQGLVTTSEHPNLCPYAQGADQIAVSANRQAFCRQHGLERLVSCTQVHGTRLVAADATVDGVVQQADALWTDQPGTAVGVFHADCVPILLATKDARLVMAIHAGRKGVAGQITPKAVDWLTQRGYAPSGLRVWLGPAICKNCYQIDAACASQCLAQGFDQANLTQQGDGFTCNLRGELLRQLSKLGIHKPCELNECTRCTSSIPRRWLSHRLGDTGRMLSCIWPGTRSG